jgi:hypothetical protein
MGHPDPHPNGEWERLGNRGHRPYLEGVGAGFTSPSLCPMRSPALRALYGVTINHHHHHDHHHHDDDSVEVVIMSAVAQLELL